MTPHGLPLYPHLWRVCDDPESGWLRIRLTRHRLPRTVASDGRPNREGILRTARTIVPLLVVILMVLSAVGIALADNSGANPASQDPFTYWTSDRMATAVPRDLVVDHRGLGYLRSSNGGLSPYGHGIAAEEPPLRSTPLAQSNPAPRLGDSPVPLAAPLIESMSPDSETIGAQHTFSARVMSTSGIKQITAYVAPSSSSSYQRFHMSYASAEGDTQIWQLNLNGFSDGAWKWYVEVRDNAPRGGNRVTSEIVTFTVDTSGSGGDGTVTHARWTDGGAVQTAAGRILFTMPDGDYVCSGTAVTDGTTGRSIVLTAAHCLYDDIAKVFTSNAIFIPNQDDGGGDRTDFDCGNDPIGCWSLDHGVVDVNWTTLTFPNNVAWDYGFYVVSDSGAHSGPGGSGALDVAAGTLAIDFTTPTTGATATALGYSYSVDPNFMYCQESLGTNGSVNYWLDSCDLTGGSSGGPWLQPLDGGNGPIISVNSWGYTTRSGMAGPKLHGTSAATLFDVATFSDLSSASRGVIVDPDNPPTSTSTTTTTTSTSTTSTTLPDNGGITLIVDNYKFRGEKRANLSWASATSLTVDIYRDGTVIVVTENDGIYADWTGLKGGGFNTWQVCEVGSTTCSEPVTVGW